MGCDAPDACDAVPDRVGRQPPHAAWRRPMRRAKPGAPWELKISGGTVVLGLRGAGRRQSADPQPHPGEAADRSDGAPHRHRAGRDRQRRIIGVALSGNIDYSSGDPRVAMGVAGTRMSVAAMKSIWPFFGAPKVRAWVEEHVVGGTIERLMIATNAPMSTLKASGPPVPDDGLAVEIVGHGAEIRPVAGPARDPRRRLQRARLRPHRHRQSRPRQRGNLARPQAVDHQRRVRGAGHLPEGAARQGAFPSRRLGAGGGRAAGVWSGCASIPACRSIRRPAAAR